MVAPPTRGMMLRRRERPFHGDLRLPAFCGALPIRAPSLRRAARRSSGGLKSLETLERGNIEDKFDLYKKRTKSALSPERRGSSAGGTGARARSASSGGNR